jgi:DUF4097 and DUF4098 domain-containing protein YvlB
VLTVAALATLVAPAFAVEKTFEATYPLSSGGSFSLTNVNGSVEIRGWDREEVQVRAVKRSRTDPAEESRVKIEVEANPGSVAVITRYPEADPVDVTVEYTIRVPARLRLTNIQTVNGDIRVRDLETGGELRTVNGDLEVLNGAGYVAARTTNGNVRLELAHIGDGSHPIRVETVNGSVALEVPASVNADLHAQSLNGDFQSDLPMEVQATSGRAEVRARLGRGGAPLVLRTVNGGIRILAARATV